jgi:phosphoribosyl 1,2-cyclic phosphodiesterase
MPLRFTVLASGSAGNASLLECDGFGVLIDLGLGPRQLAGRLAAVGASWQRIHAAILTHTHGDHWRERTLAHLLQHDLPIYCHPEHAIYLRHQSRAFSALARRKLVRRYEPGADLEVATGLRCRPLEVCHDAGATCGFRFEGSPGFLGQQSALAYVTDLGCWQAGLVDALADVDVLALEFNHDVGLERTSGRPWHLVARVLGDQGHLSNAQAAELLAEVLRRSEPGRLRHVVQLHLSRDCNRPELAVTAVRKVLSNGQAKVQIHTALQHQPGPSLLVGLATPKSHTTRLSSPRREPMGVACAQPWLPGWHD